MKKTILNFLKLNIMIILCSLTPRVCEGNPQAREKLKNLYEENSTRASDICQHVPTLRDLARECATVTEIGTRGMVSTWGILEGLAENPSRFKTYIGIDLAFPPRETLNLARQLALENGISFQFWNKNDMTIDIQPTELLFIDSLHTYAHLSYELEKFSSKVSKYIAMHDTSAPWGENDDTEYRGDYSEYPLFIDRNKRGLWQAVEDFLDRHPEWSLHERYFNNYGFTILRRN